MSKNVTEGRIPYDSDRFDAVIRKERESDTSSPSIYGCGYNYSNYSSMDIIQNCRFKLERSLDDFGIAAVRF